MADNLTDGLRETISVTAGGYIKFELLAALDGIQRSYDALAELYDELAQLALEMFDLIPDTGAYCRKRKERLAERLDEMGIDL